MALGVADYASVAGFGLDLTEAAEALVTEGRVARDHADRLLTWLTDASQDGSFFAYGIIVVATGRVPRA